MDSIYKTELERKLLELCEKALASLGYRVVDLDCKGSGKVLLRVFVEKKETGQVSIDDCVTVSRHLEPLIEAENLFEASYELEVSSPGLDRRLRLMSDFQSVIGKELKLGLLESIPGFGSQLRGELLAISPGKLEMKVSGKEVSVPVGQIKKAQTVWEFRI